MSVDISDMIHDDIQEMLDERFDPEISLAVISEYGSRRFKQNGKLRFTCDCGHKWTTSKGLYLISYKKVDD
jgi:hypothetical protein